jgi:tRNA(adenine34) deaminase
MNSLSSDTNTVDTFYMELAIAEAQQAAMKGEVPVGAVVVCGGNVIGRGHNQREQRQNPLCHAEILAIEAAARQLQSWRLNECNIYATLEPCIMCVGAILQARIRRLVFGCLDPKAGALMSLYRLGADRRDNHQLAVVGGVMARDCTSLLSGFFCQLREQKRNG